jgi:Putative adhesin
MKLAAINIKMQMKRLPLAVLAVTVVAILSAASARADEWSKTYTLNGKPDLRIETSDANIRVTTWDQNTIEAKVITSHYKIGEGGIRVEEHQSGDSVEIDVHFPHNISVGFMHVDWGHKVDIIIQMPREGKVNLHTGDGKIELAGLKGDMKLHTGDGSMNLEGVDGDLHASTGDGHINAQGRFDDLELKTGDGHVDARATSGSTLATGWRLETGDGSVSLEVPGELAADVDLHTSDGHIDLDMPITTEGKIRENEIHGKLNGGDSPLIIHTGDGSIHLRKG